MEDVEVKDPGIDVEQVRERTQESMCRSRGPRNRCVGVEDPGIDVEEVGKRPRDRTARGEPQEDSPDRFGRPPSGGRRRGSGG